MLVNTQMSDIQDEIYETRVAPKKVRPTLESQKIEQNQKIVDEIKRYYELSENNEIEGNTGYDRGFNNSKEQDKICLDEISSYCS